MYLLHKCTEWIAALDARSDISIVISRGLRIVLVFFKSMDGDGRKPHCPKICDDMCAAVHSSAGYG